MNNRLLSLALLVASVSLCYAGRDVSSHRSHAAYRVCRPSALERYKDKMGELYVFEAHNGDTVFALRSHQGKVACFLASGNKQWARIVGEEWFNDLKKLYEKR